ncbi:hypothetical protein [Paraglaciecola sp.]|uniref:hypothetical protein n=1 Tax=Paraglaciecola sp. TaxID=1920173 RepID=UPI00273DC91B|nr:hypothetical protein [Paraglaciecola sp.]MDP5031381.1 hypothetical protein [Paraglaciecola sp.]
MQKNQASEERNRSVFFNVSVVFVFVALMVIFIVYFYVTAPNIKRVNLDNLANSFTTSVNSAHWQWQAQGRPEIIIMSTFAPRLDDEKTLVEVDKHPVFMNAQGWPKAEFTGQGCEEIWSMVLNTSLQSEGFRVIAEFYDGVKLSGDTLQSRCRYRLSTGQYFEYKVFTGEVIKH